MDKTSIGSDVTKSVIDSVKERKQLCIHLGGYHSKSCCILRKSRVNLFIIRILELPCFLESALEFRNLELFKFDFDPVFIDHPVYIHVLIYKCFQAAQHYNERKW